MASSEALISIGLASLAVNGVGLVTNFYSKVLDLHVPAQDGEDAKLGAGSVPLTALQKVRRSEDTQTKQVKSCAGPATGCEVACHRLSLRPIRAPAVGFEANTGQLRKNKAKFGKYLLLKMVRSGLN